VFGSCFVDRLQGGKRYHYIIIHLFIGKQFSKRV
jgi:hypothetical protein